jgi:hypothetical protein
MRADYYSMVELHTVVYFVRVRRVSTINGVFAAEVFQISSGYQAFRQYC